MVARCTMLTVLALLAAACARPPRPLARETPVPTALDSVATERWLAGQKRACPGMLITLFDESMIAPAGHADSAVAYRYVRTVTGVRCTPDR